MLIPPQLALLLGLSISALLGPLAKEDEPSDVLLPKSTDLKTTPQFPTGLQNGSLNVLDGNGIPQGWSVVGSPLIATENGNSFARSNNNNRVQQEFFRLQNDQHFTLTCRVRGTVGNETSTISFFATATTEGFFQQFRGRLTTTEWKQLYFTVDLVEQTGPTGILLIPSSSDRFTWVDWDDFGFITVGFQQGGFESTVALEPVQNWAFQNAAITNDFEALFTGSNVLAIEPGGWAEQYVSLLAGEHRYLTEFRAQAPSQAATLFVDRVILDSGGEQLSSELIFQQTLAPGESLRTFFSEDAPTTSSASVALYRFRTAPEQGLLLLDEVQRGYGLITPNQFNPSDSATYSQARGLFVWPQEKRTVSLRYRDPEGQVQRMINHQLTTESFRDNWDPASSLVPGLWTVEVDFTDGLHTSTLELPWSVEPVREYPVPQPDVQTQFEVSAWLWLRGLGTTVEQLRPYIEQLKTDLVDYPVIFASNDQWAAVRAVCEELDYDFVAADFALIYLYKNRQPSNERYPEERFREQAETSLAPLLGSPNLKGVYLMDEPALEDQAVTTALMNRVYASFSPPLDGYTIFAVGLEAPNALERILPARYWTDIYPTQLSRPNLRDNLLLLSSELERDVARAKSVGLHHGLVLQVFEIPDSFRVGPPAMVSSTVGIAIAQGSQGLHPFAYISIGNNEGLRNRQLELMPYGETWLQQVQRIQPIKQQTFRRESISAPQVTENLLWTTSLIPGETRQLVVVSLQPRNPVSVTLEFDQDVSLFEPTLNQQFQTTEGQLQFTLEPGGWRYFNLPLSTQSPIITSQLFAAQQLLPSVPLSLDRTITNQNLRGVAYSPSSLNYSAVSLNSAYLTFISSLVSSPAFGSQLLDVAFQNESTLLVGDESFGLYRITSGFGQFGSAVPLVTRRTGNILYMDHDQNFLLASQRFKGVSAFDLSLEGPEIPTLTSSRNISEARGVAVIPGTTSAYVADQDLGIRLFNLVQPPQGQAQLMDALVYESDRLNDLSYQPQTNRLAVSRLRRGLAILQETTLGESLQEIAEFNPGFESIEFVEWISPTLLAAVEWDGDCHFLTQSATGTWESVAFWPTVVTTATCTDATTNGSQLLLSFSNGRLIGLNTVPLQQQLSARDTWSFF